MPRTRRILLALLVLVAAHAPCQDEGAATGARTTGRASRRPSTGPRVPAGGGVIVLSGMRCVTGTIEGRVLEFMLRDLGYIWEPGPFRPRLLCFYDCRRVRLTGVTFHDSPFWTVHLAGCEGVDISGLLIDNNLAVPSCDDIDPDHCRDVRIHDCRVSCADDAIVLKSTGRFAHRGDTADIHVSAVSRTAAQADGRRAEWNPKALVGTIRGVRFADIQAHSEGDIVLWGSPESLLRDIELDSVSLCLNKWSRRPGGYLDIRPVALQGSDVFIDPAHEPGRIGRSVPAVLARSVRGLRLRAVDLRWGARRPDCITGLLCMEDAEDVVVEGLTAEGAQ